MVDRRWAMIRVVREQGTREELLARDGVFAQLYRTQSLVEGKL